MKNKIIGSLFQVSIAFWRRETSVRQYIGVPMSPAPLLLADRWFYILYVLSEQKKLKKEADQTVRYASPIFKPIAY
jgi:hypothetical protein